MDKSSLSSAARRRRVACFEWSLSQGRPVSGAAVTAVLGAKSVCPMPVDRWTESDVRELLWVGVARWCDARAIEAPPDVSEAMWTLLDHLRADDAYHAGSDPDRLLRVPIVELGGLDPKGRRRHPSGPVAS